MKTDYTLQKLGFNFPVTQKDNLNTVKIVIKCTAINYIFHVSR